MGTEPTAADSANYLINYLQERFDAERAIDLPSLKWIEIVAVGASVRMPSPPPPPPPSAPPPPSPPPAPDPCDASDAAVFFNTSLGGMIAGSGRVSGRSASRSSPARAAPSSLPSSSSSSGLRAQQDGAIRSPEPVQDERGGSTAPALSRDAAAAAHVGRQAPGLGEGKTAQEEGEAPALRLLEVDDGRAGRHPHRPPLLPLAGVREPEGGGAPPRRQRRGGGGAGAGHLPPLFVASAACIAISVLFNFTAVLRLYFSHSKDGTDYLARTVFSVDAKGVHKARRRRLRRHRRARRRQLSKG